jgi:hypothetical protein
MERLTAGHDGEAGRRLRERCQFRHRQLGDRSPVAQIRADTAQFLDRIQAPRVPLMRRPQRRRPDRNRLLQLLQPVTQRPSHAGQEGLAVVSGEAHLPPRRALPPLGLHLTGRTEMQPEVVTDRVRPARTLVPGTGQDRVGPGAAEGQVRLERPGPGQSPSLQDELGEGRQQHLRAAVVDDIGGPSVPEFKSDAGAVSHDASRTAGGAQRTGVLREWVSGALVRRGGCAGARQQPGSCPPAAQGRCRSAHEDR